MATCRNAYFWQPVGITEAGWLHGRCYPKQSDIRSSDSRIHRLPSGLINPHRTQRMESTLFVAEKGVGVANDGCHRELSN